MSQKWGCADLETSKSGVWTPNTTRVTRACNENMPWPRDHGTTGNDWFVFKMFKPQSTSLWKILAGWLTTEQTASDWASNYVFSAWHGGTAQGLLEWTCQVPQNLEKILQQVISTALTKSGTFYLIFTETKNTASIWKPHPSSHFQGKLGVVQIISVSNETSWEVHEIKTASRSRQSQPAPLVTRPGDQ